MNTLDELEPLARNFLRNGNRLEAIKLMRNVLGSLTLADQWCRNQPEYKKIVSWWALSNGVPKNTWLPAGDIGSYPVLHSDVMEFVPILLAFPRRGLQDPMICIGRYYAGHLNEFRQDGSPGAQTPTHFMVMPSFPTTPDYPQ